MSFAALDLESQNPPSTGPQASEVDDIIKSTSSQIQNYSSLINSFSNERKLVGTRRDCAQLRAKLDQSQENIQQLGGAIQKLMSNINAVITSEGASKQNPSDSTNNPINGQLLMKDRILAEFNSLQSSFQTQVREYNAKKKSSSLPETTPLLAHVQGGSATANRPQPQTQMQVQDEIDESELQYHVLLTQERNRQIEQVQDGIREVNSIFKDLGELVNVQGAQLDTVEENVLQMSANANSAAGELKKANEYQRRKSKWSCILLCALCVFVLVAVLVVIS